MVRGDRKITTSNASNNNNENNNNNNKNEISETPIIEPLIREMHWLNTSYNEKDPADQVEISLQYLDIAFHSAVESG